MTESSFVFTLHDLGRHDGAFLCRDVANGSARCRWTGSVVDRGATAVDLHRDTQYLILGCFGVHGRGEDVGRYELRYEFGDSRNSMLMIS